MPDRWLRPLMLVPDFDRIGGYELQALSQAAHLVRHGVPAMILTNNHFRQPPREVRSGVVIQRLEGLPPTSGNWAALFRAFLTFLRSHRAEYDVIHCHALTFLSACCVRIGRLLGVPVLVKVATERDVREYRDNRSLEFRLFFRWLRTADRLLCLSAPIQQEAIACGFRAERTVIAPNGVDTDRFAPAAAAERAAARAALDLPEGAVGLLYVGRLVRRKGVDVLLDALAALPPPAADARLLVVGDGDQGDTLRAQAARLGLGGRVRFCGEHQDVQPFLRAADAFVFPSRLEGLPNALLEAMASGLPSIATRIGGCTDVCGDGSGVLVPPDDAPALAAAIADLALDPARRAALGQAARARIDDHFAFARVAERMQAIYRDCLARR